MEGGWFMAWVLPAGRFAAAGRFMAWLPSRELLAEAGRLVGRFAPKELFAPPGRVVDWLAGTERPAELDRFAEGVVERFWLMERLEAWECAAGAD
jgi:hypothetical protein